jgi:hypothetical protein
LLIKSGIPTAKSVSQFLIENPGADLEQIMGTSPTPAHLLLFHHPFTDDLVDGRFYKGDRNFSSNSFSLL